MSGYWSVVGGEGRRLLVQVDKFIFALVTGTADQTISSGLALARAGAYGPVWRAATAPLRWAVDAVARVGFGQSRHCAQAVEPDDR